MKEQYAVATWDEESDGWDIEFPKGILGETTAGTHTIDKKHTRWHAEFMARDLVVGHADSQIDVNDVELSIEWRGEAGYWRWYERRYGRKPPPG